MGEQAQRCLRVFSGEPWTLDDLTECYGSERETSGGDRPPRNPERAFTESSDEVDQRLYAGLTAMFGRPPDPSVEGGFVAVPEALIRQVDAAYEVVSRHDLRSDGELADALAKEWNL